jgi:hypothetical protein
MDDQEAEFVNEVDWDRKMLELDFAGDPRWRNGNEAAFFGNVPWQSLERLTLFHVSQRMTAALMAEPELQRQPSFADYELMRRHELDGFPETAPEKPHIMQHLLPPDPEVGRSRSTLIRLRGINPPATDRFQQERGKGTFTYGIKLNALVALTWHSTEANPVAADGRPSLPGDPHPAHHILVRPPEELVKVAPTMKDCITMMVDTVAQYLNQTDKVVAMVRDPSEDTYRHQMESVFLQLLASGKPYDEARLEMAEKAFDDWSEDEDDNDLPDPFHEYFASRSTPSPSMRCLPEPFVFSLPDVAKLVLDMLPNVLIDLVIQGGANLDQPYLSIRALLTAAGFPIPEPREQGNLMLGDLQLKHIAQIAAVVPEVLASDLVTQSLTAQDMVELQRRIQHIIQARVFAGQHDGLAYHLPGMRRRYHTFSVSNDEHANLNNVLARHYEHCPSHDAMRPVDLYHWVPIEVASPVFSVVADRESIVGALGAVSDTFKRRLRTHHCALPSLDLTTSIFIGHTEGFTLLELKKFVTLYLLIEQDIARLHRRHRYTTEGRWPCEPLRTRSRLGALVSQPLDAPLNDPKKILPHPIDAVRESLTGLMHLHFAVADIVNRTNDEDELFLRAVWLYTSVSDLARALETTGPPFRTSVAIRCAGRGERTTHLRKDSDLITAANSTEPSFPGEIDRHRGVIEFRNMGQNLDSETILNWTGICVNIVRTVRETNPPAFRELIHLITRGDISLTTLFHIPPSMITPFMSKDEGSPNSFYMPQEDATVDYRFPFYK